MAITRKVDTDVYCDICGKWVMGWTSNNDGVSRAWAAKYARKKGCTVGKKIICKECRIEKRIQTCSIQQKIGSAGRDSDGTCMENSLNISESRKHNPEKLRGNPDRKRYFIISIKCF